MTTKEIVVPPEISNVRIDIFLAKELAENLSRTRIKQLIEEGQIRIKGRTSVKPHTLVMAGDEILVDYEAKSGEMERAEHIPLDIVYEDEDVIVVNKPVGMVVHPACGNPSGTLVNALLYHTKSLSAVGNQVRPGIVHRLDKDTSGLLVIAKNDQAHRNLAAQFKRHEIDRRYWVVVKGVVQHDEMRSDEPLGRSVMNRKRVVIKPDDGKPAATLFRVLKRFRNATLLEARPETGRTHQIRVHLRALGYPVLGDLVYGVISPHIGRQALHAKELGFIHPRTKEKLFFSSEIPSDMESLLSELNT